MAKKAKKPTKSIETLEAEYETRRAELEADLNDYALKRREDIKNSILAANQELIETSKQVEKKKVELTELNEVYLQEQEELRQSNADVKRIIEENNETIAASQEKVDEVRDELKELEFKRDNALISMKKAEDQHEKFLDYERRAKAALDKRDRELQAKAADLATDKKFLKSQRSLLPEL